MYRFILLFMIVTGAVFADNTPILKEQITAEFQASKGDIEKKIDDMFKNKIGSIGYSIINPNTYKGKGVGMISFHGMINKKALRPLLLQNPDFGAYTPFNFLVYKTLDHYTWYGHLSPNAMLDIIGEKNRETRNAFTDMVESLDGLVTKTLRPSKGKLFIHTQPLPENGLTKMVKKFDVSHDMETFVKNFVMEYDRDFSKQGFMITGFIDLKFEYSNMDLDFDKYDAYWISSISHFEFSSAILNRGTPEAGIFIPCSIYFYIPKGKNELHIGYANAENFITALDVKDIKKAAYMRKIDAKVVEIFKELGFNLLK